nr:MAG TPA: major tail protein [Caudoviricetes sp.]
MYDAGRGAGREEGLMAGSIRTLGDGRITLVALGINGAPVADRKRPTAEELNKGLHFEMSVMKSDYKLGSKGSTSVEEPVLGAAGKGTVPGPAEYEGQVSVYWFFNEDGQKVAGGDNRVWELLSETGREFELYEREGKKPDKPFVDGDDVDWYHVAPGQPQKPDDRTTYTKRTVSLFISDALENEITLGAGTAASKPTVTKIEPPNGKAGSTVIITGTNFVNVTRVTCTVRPDAAGDVALFKTLSPTSIAAVLPAGVTTGNFIVYTRKGHSDGVAYTAGA